MRAYINKNNKVLCALATVFAVIALLFAIMYGKVIAFNNVQHQYGDDDFVQFKIYVRGGATDSWVKSSSKGNKIKGTIFEAAIVNYSDYLINNWDVRIDIKDDCWINNAWNGEVEVHQNVKNGELVQTLDLIHMSRNFDIQLEHYYDGGDLLINLYEGDYIIYHPCKDLYEDPILSKNGHQTIGLIFYNVFPKILDISGSNATFSYYYKRTLIEEPLFKVLLILSLIWLVTILTYLIRQISMHKKKEYANQLALEEALEDARRANEAKSAFLATVSHEIRTPINAVLGMNTMILRESNQEEIRRYSREIGESGKVLLTLVNDILDLSKIESGKMEIIPVEYDVSDVIKNVIDMVKPKAIEKNLDLFADIDKRIPARLYGDEVRIKQIIINILNNAVKYTKRGNVTLKMEAEFVNEEKIVLKVSVKDTGIGIKDEDISRLFSRYERLDEEKNRNIEGTGLGLNITNRLLDLMGSHLEVESEYGRGSEFSFELIQKVISFEPIGKISFAEPAKAPALKKETFHAPQANILVIDDVKMNQVVIRSLLKRIQCQIDTCDSGREGLAYAKTKKYDLIFIDHMMPNMDGIDTLHAMKEECELNKDTPKIVLTANVLAGAKEEYLKEGFTNYLSKPVDDQELERMVKEYIPQSKVLELTEEVNTLSKYNEIEDLDIEQGIKHSGSEEMYEKILKLFVESSTEEDVHIKEYADNLDYENYTVEAHGIKSSAKTIGAKKLASIAFEMEMAGKLKDRKKIMEDTPRLIEEHRKLVMNIAQIG